MTEIVNPLDPSIFPLPRSQWTPDDKHKKCMLCRSKFSGVFRSGKHHCRKCGFVVCKKCCKMRIRKQMVCKDCYGKYHKYESVFIATIVGPVDEGNKVISDDSRSSPESESEDDSLDDSLSKSSLMMLDIEESTTRFRRESVTRKEPLILSGGYEDSIDESISVVHRDKPTIVLHHDSTINTVRDDRTDALFKNNRISYSVDYVANNVEADILLQSAALATSGPSSSSASSSSESSFHPITPRQPLLAQSVDPLTPCPPSPDPHDPLSPSLGSQDDDELSNASSGQRLSSHISHISSKHINAQLSDTEVDDKHSALSHSASTAPSSPSSSSAAHRQSRPWRQSNRKRKRHSRRQFERSQRRRRENMDFLQFNNINVYNNFIQFGGGTAGNHNVAMLQCMMGMLKLHIEQLAIYTERVREIEADDELKRVQWTAEDVWNAVRRREKDDERYWRELKRKQALGVHGEEEIEEKQSVHRNIDKICNQILNSNGHRQEEKEPEAPTMAINETKEQMDCNKSGGLRVKEGMEHTPDVIHDPRTLMGDNDDDEESDIGCDAVDREPLVRHRRKSTFDAMQSVLSDDEIDDDHGHDINNRGMGNLGTIDERTEMDLGFEDIYESIVAYECDIKSLCDLILKEMSSNNRMKEELHSFRSSNEDFRNQLQSLQSEYDAVIDDLHEKEYLLELNNETEQNLMDVIEEHEANRQRDRDQMDKLRQEIESLRSSPKNHHDGHRNHHRLTQSVSLNAPSQSTPSASTLPFISEKNGEHDPLLNGGSGHSPLQLDELTLDMDRLKGNGAETLSQTELSSMVEQLNTKLHGMKHKLRSNEERLQKKATKQREKYKMFLDKMNQKDLNANDLAMISSDDGDGGTNNDDEQKDEEEVNVVAGGDDARETETESEYTFDIEKEKRRLKDIGYDTKEAQRIASILTYEKCASFKETISGMKRWVKHSKQEMRNLKTEFAENHQYLELKLSKFSDMKDDLYYQRGEVFQMKQQLRQYAKETTIRINEEEHLVEIKKLEQEQYGQRLADKEEALRERELLLEKEKKAFDEMSRCFNQKKIDDELKNAQMFSAKMLEIEKKERSVVGQFEQLEITRQFVMKQKEICSKERELIHQQQQQVFFNERQLKQQQAAMSSDQSYVQQEYIDAREKFEGDRYVLVDKINRLETENITFKMDVDSMSKRLSLQTDICQNLEQQIQNLKEQLSVNQTESKKLKTSQFNKDQEITNLQNEVAMANARISKYEAAAKANDERNVQQLKLHSSEKQELQNENATLQLEVNSLKDEIEIFKIKYEHNIGGKAKKKKKSKKSSKTGGLKKSSASSRNLKDSKDRPKLSKRAKSTLSAVSSSKKTKERSRKDVDSKLKLKGKSKSKSRLYK